MAYDDEPYWFQQKPSVKKYTKVKKENNNLPSKSPNYPDASEVMARIEREPRQAKPDPLLVEWLAKKNKELPKD